MRKAGTGSRWPCTADRRRHRLRVQGGGRACCGLGGGLRAGLAAVLARSGSAPPPVGLLASPAARPVGPLASPAPPPPHAQGRPGWPVLLPSPPRPSRSTGRKGRGGEGMCGAAAVSVAAAMRREGGGGASGAWREWPLSRFGRRRERRLRSARRIRVEGRAPRPSPCGRLGMSEARLRGRLAPPCTSAAHHQAPPSPSARLPLSPLRRRGERHVFGPLPFPVRSLAAPPARIPRPVHTHTHPGPPTPRRRRQGCRACGMGGAGRGQVAMNAMYVSLMAFFARVSDKRMGGTYMTLLNTVPS